MSDSKTTRLEAIRTAIDAVVAAVAGGEYMLSYTTQDGRSYRGESSMDLLEALRNQEKELEAEIAAESPRTGGMLLYARLTNEPQST